MKPVVGIVLAIVAAIFVGQFFCEIKGDCAWSPSEGFEWVADRFVDAAEWLGKWAAVLSSYLEFIANLIDWIPFKNMIVKIFTPIFRAIFVPFFAFGFKFAEKVASYNHPDLVLGGALTIVVVAWTLRFIRLKNGYTVYGWIYKQCTSFL